VGYWFVRNLAAGGLHYRFGNLMLVQFPAVLPGVKYKTVFENANGGANSPLFCE